MKSFLFLALGLVFSVAALNGCGSSGDGIKPEDQKVISDVNAIAMKSGGNYDKLTPHEKRQILQLANNNEDSARKLLNMMAHPPNANWHDPAAGRAPK